MFAYSSAETSSDASADVSSADSAALSSDSASSDSACELSAVCDEVTAEEVPAVEDELPLLSNEHLVTRFAFVFAEIGIGCSSRDRAGQPFALAGLQHNRNDKKNGHQQQQTADYIIKNIHFPDSSESPFYAVNAFDTIP